MPLTAVPRRHLSIAPLAAGGPVALLALLLAACGAPGGESAVAAIAPAAGPPAPAIQRLDPPAGPGAMAPNLHAGAGGVYLSWIEPVDGGHRLRVSRLEGRTWSEPADVARGTTFFANWADVPGVVEAEDGALYAHWLEKLGPGTYAYGVQLARSADGGRTWEGLGLLHDDASETEHGFVSWQPLDDGVQAAWLDGRATADGGAMQLRATTVSAGGPQPSTVVAPSVCDCCPTAMARTAGGPIVAFRGRTEGEIRDVAVARAAGGAWSAPLEVHDDGWRIAGCPVNGPSIDADGERVAIAWFTAAGARARVQAAFSDDGGATFGPPILLDADKPLGRVGLVLDGDAAWVLWLATRDGRGELRLQRIQGDHPTTPPILITP
ncbi:MAG: exo-alpha-sialidase, partial [Acidobacteria bacterium]